MIRSIFSLVLNCSKPNHPYQTQHVLLGLVIQVVRRRQRHSSLQNKANSSHHGHDDTSANFRLWYPLEFLQRTAMTGFPTTWDIRCVKVGSAPKRTRSELD